MIAVSRKYQLTFDDLGKIGKGLLIAMAGAGLTYLTEQIPNVELGDWTPVVVAFFSVAVNLARKWLEENRYIVGQQ